ncbi:hypothetical protein CTAYLR_009740 [Chrysophaeum taylorii]|uniref:Ubiquitin fusion degradaton protein n=1 Tax=Chrysophaeum taylorii TaxID=2483200 RepID=A0AAD7UHR2_9STRA|nr:hypothetical protein CTAYLR_009740 [Chrysophaeum taylorii]
MLFGAHLGETFDEQYHCFSGAFADKPQLEEGDKILLPSSAFEQLARLQIEYPMLFELRSARGRTHCGVMEFTAPEGNCYLPFWMLQNLMLEEGGLVHVKNVSLPKATFVKFKPQSADFLDISNPRAVLERQLRTFSCVTVGDQICLPYNGRRYFLEVQEVRPGDAACIIETDCNVDFDAPVGYREPPPPQRGPEVPEPQKARREEEEEVFQAFQGSGQRLDGKDLKDAQAAKLQPLPTKKPPPKPNFDSAGMTASGSAPKAMPPKPAPKFKPAASKWAKNAKPAFSGTGNKLSGGP